MSFRKISKMKHFENEANGHALSYLILLWLCPTVVSCDIYGWARWWWAGEEASKGNGQDQPFKKAAKFICDPLFSSGEKTQFSRGSAIFWQPSKASDKVHFGIRDADLAEHPAKLVFHFVMQIDGPHFQTIIFRPLTTESEPSIKYVIGSVSTCCSHTLMSLIIWDLILFDIYGLFLHQFLMSTSTINIFIFNNFDCRWKCL